MNCITTPITKTCGSHVDTLFNFYGIFLSFSESRKSNVLVQDEGEKKLIFG